MASEQQRKKDTPRAEVDEEKIKKVDRGYQEGNEEGERGDKKDGGAHFESIADKVAELEGKSESEKEKTTDSTMRANVGGNTEVEVKEASHVDDQQQLTESIQGKEGKETESKEHHEEAEGKLSEHEEKPKGFKEKYEVKEGEEEAREPEENPKGSYSVSKFELAEEGEKGTEKGRKEGGVHQREEIERPSREEISSYRQTAQENSMEAIRAAEERHKHHKRVTLTLPSHAIGAAAVGVDQLSSQAEENAERGAHISEKGGSIKDAAVEKTWQGYVAAKYTIADAGRTVVDYTKQTAEQAEEYDGEKAAEAKDKATSTAKSVAGFVEEKTVSGKDAAVENGKSAVGLAGKLAVDVKEKAVVAGWGAAHYTTGRPEW
ncbi:hypothetical protein Nepgr_012928 [Nepenthes gracilis]|uniref:Seed biotin-containing protein SBP65 n=1 Tax=Nepenthes gracilis TaxID=150966 RepID=A0AAD3SI49_NEPGR|nr:hypothetical protein Nepgr_012928 [Nepenthes gracilis]